LSLNYYTARRASTKRGAPVSATTQKLRQNTSYLQLGGINNWLYTVMTIFAQRFNICNQKLGTDRAFRHQLAPRMAALTNDFDSFLQLQTRRQLMPTK